MELEFILAKCTTVHFKCIIKSEVVIFLLYRKNKETKWYFRANFKNFLKGSSFHCKKIVDQQHL